jgi:hypothetical protein
MRDFKGYGPTPTFPNGGTKPYASAQQTGAISTNLFSTAVTLALNAAVTCKADDLANQTNKIMLLDELRFEAQRVTGAFTPAPVSPLFLAAKLQIGRFLIVPRPTQLGLICKPWDRVIQGSYNYYAIESGAVVLRFKKPLVMRQNDYLQLTLSYDVPNGYLATGNAYADNSTYPVQVTGVGRLVNDAPSQEYLPFISAYMPDYTIANFTTQSLIESFSSDLMNPNAEPLLVDHLLGLGQVATGGNVPPGDISLFRTTNPIGLGWNGTQVQIISAGDRDADIHENFGIRDFQPFYHVFPQRDRSWNFRAALKPQSYLQVRQLLTDWQDLVGAGASTAYRFGVGMVGYYKVTPRMAQTYGRHMPQY